MNKRTTILLSVTILMLGIIIIGLVLRYAVFVTDSEPKLFSEEKKVAASVLYEDIKAHDPDLVYPKTPEELMDLYIKMSLLVFGDMIIDDELYLELVQIQRKLFSLEIITANSEENQYQTLLETLKVLKEYGGSVTEMEREQTIYPPTDTNTCVIPVKQYVVGANYVYWNYYIQKFDGKWKIQTWERTDENYNPE